MSDPSDLIARLQKELQRGGLYSSAGVITRDITALLEALSSQSLSLSEAREEIERLRARVNRLVDIGLHHQDRADAAEKALKPFAAIAGIFDHVAGNRPREGEIMSWVDHRVGERVLTVEALRQARSALENGPAGLADATNNPASTDLSSLRKGAEVAVKPLVWEDGYAFVPGWSGHYRLIHYPGRKCWSLGGHGFPDHPRRNYATEAEAKAAAQTDYETRIRSALVSGSRENGE